MIQPGFVKEGFKFDLWLVTSVIYTGEFFLSTYILSIFLFYLTILFIGTVLKEALTISS